MTGRIIVGWVVAAGLFTFGWCVGVAIHRRASDETQIRLYRRLLVAEANQDHAMCQAHIDHQERLLDQFRAGRDTGDEAEEYLSLYDIEDLHRREGGS